MPGKLVVEDVLATPQLLHSEYEQMQGSGVVSGAFLEICCCTELFRLMGLLCPMAQW